MENAALQSFTINAAYVPDGGVLVADVTPVLHPAWLRIAHARVQDHGWLPAQLSSIARGTGKKKEHSEQSGGRWRGWWWHIDGEDDEVHARQVSCLTPKMTACM